MKPEAKVRSIVAFVSATLLYWASMYLYMPIMSVHAEKNLGASMAMVGVIVATYGLGQFLFRLPVGILSDRLGRRKPFMIAGTVLTGSGALIMGLAQDPVTMAVGRQIVGIGASAWVATTVLFASYFPASSVTRALGLVSFCSGIGILTASFAGGIIADQFGWNAPFLIAAGLGALGVLAALTVQETPMPPRKGVPPREILRICTIPSLVAVSAVSALSTWTLWATVNTFSPIYASGHLGASRSDLGILATVAQLANALCMLVGPVMAEKLGARKTLIGAIVLQAATSLAVPFILDFNILLVDQFLGGATRAVTFVITMALAVRDVRAEDKATAMGVYQSSYAVGMFVGPFASGLFGDALGISSVFTIGAAVVLLGIPIVLLLSNKASA